MTLADQIATDTVVARPKAVIEPDSERQAGNLLKERRVSRDPGRHNETDPDRFQVRLVGVL